MKKLFLWLDANFEDVLCAFFLVGIMILLMMQVIVRSTTGQGVTFSEDLCRFFFLYLTYFASSLAAHRGAHIRVTAHIRLMPPRIQLFLITLADIIWLLFNAIVIFQGFKLIRSMAINPMVSGGIMLDMRYIFIAVPIGFILMEYRILVMCWRRFKRDVDGLAVDEQGEHQ